MIQAFRTAGQMDQRKFPRFTVELQVLVSGDETEGEGMVYNLSYGGCAVRSHAQLVKGAFLRLQVYLEVRVTPLVIDLAPVRWVTKNEFGLEFIRMSPRDQALLLDYISVFKTEGPLVTGGYAIAI